VGDLIQSGGRGLVRKYKTLANLLAHHYPELVQQQSDALSGLPIGKSVSHGFWKSKENQRLFLESLGKQLNLSSPEQWANVSVDVIYRSGGRQLLRIYPSFITALREIYPECDWNVFERVSVPRNFWKSPENIRLFLDKLKTEFSIKQPSDWSRVSSEMLISHGGGSLVNSYGSIFEILRFSQYEQYPWDDLQAELSKRHKRSAQRWLFLQLQKLYPEEELVEDYLHEQITSLAQFAVEFDVFIPRLNMAFEYHGEHHYRDNPAFGALELFQTRDQTKQEFCQKLGISLIVIPYWWDGRLSSLKETIEQKSQPQVN
jgi:hypothetical protein